MQKTRQLIISDTEESYASALKMADEFIDPLSLDAKKKLYLRLLAEETIGMVRAMTKRFRAVFWMEEEEGEYRVNLTVDTQMDLDKKKEFLSVSTTGKNASVKGFMGKIREIIENGLLNYDSVMKLEQEYSGGYVDYVLLGSGCVGELPMTYPVGSEGITWTLSNYREALSAAPETDKPEKEAWDELEKSIVANIAKEVTVGVRKNRVDMTIIAK